MSLTINANHSSSYYLRNFYSSNRSAASTDSYRSRSSNHTLVLADSEALKKAAEALSDLDYDDSDEANGLFFFFGLRLHQESEEPYQGSDLRALF